MKTRFYVSKLIVYGDGLVIYTWYIKEKGEVTMAFMAETERGLTPTKGDNLLKHSVDRLSQRLTHGTAKSKKYQNVRMFKGSRGYSITAPREEIDLSKALTTKFDLWYYGATTEFYNTLMEFVVKTLRSLVHVELIYDQPLEFTLHGDDTFRIDFVESGVTVSILMVKEFLKTGSVTRFSFFNINFPKSFTELTPNAKVFAYDIKYSLVGSRDLAFKKIEPLIKELPVLSKKKMKSVNGVRSELRHATDYTTVQALVLSHNFVELQELLELHDDIMDNLFDGEVDVEKFLDKVNAVVMYSDTIALYMKDNNTIITIAEYGDAIESVLFSVNLSRGTFPTAFRYEG